MRNNVSCSKSRKETILERIWGWDYEGTTRTVDNFIASLRKKLKFDTASTVQIKAVPRMARS